MREIPHINIQEPPVTELKKQRSCLKRSCVTGCGCIVFFFFGILILLNLLTGSGTHEVKDVPEAFPTDIVVYDAERIDTIHVSDHAVRGELANIFAIVPKAFLVSTYMVLGDATPTSIRSYYDTATVENTSTFNTFWRLMQEPLTPESEQIVLTWRELAAEPRFVQEYYVNALETAGYTITVTANTQTRRQLLFEKTPYIGSLLIRDTSPESKGTDYVEITVSLPFTP